MVGATRVDVDREDAHEKAPLNMLYKALAHQRQESIAGHFPEIVVEDLYLDGASITRPVNGLAPNESVLV